MPKNKNEIDNFQIDDTIGFLVNRLAFVFRQEMTGKFKTAGLDLTPEECVLLNKLWQNDGQKQNDLAESTIRNQTTVTRIIDKLEKKNLVTRQHCKKDRRQVLAWLTPRGGQLRQKVVPLILTVLDEAGSYTTPKELKITISTLKKIVNGFQDKKSI